MAVAAAACLLVLVLAATGTAGARTLQASSTFTAIEKQLTSVYLTNNELIAHMQDFAARCKSISKLYKYGTSVSGVPLMALEVSAQPGINTGKPMVKYAANIHGDEISGRQLLLLFAEQLCAQYQQPGSDAARVVSSLRMLLIPTLNPDGYTLKQRENKNGIDLNRNFPDRVYNAGRDLRVVTARQQPEVAAIMNFTLQLKPVASLSFHEGSVVANYPWDGYDDGSTDLLFMPSICPDDSTFKRMASLYATLHTTMSKSTEFPGGITNGAQWYPVYGGQQDWSYVAANCMEITMEISNDKSPNTTQLALIWMQNQRALMQWPIKTVLAGLRGRVVGVAAGGRMQPVAATITIKDTGAALASDPLNGYFARVLAPGTYQVTVKAAGYKSVSTPLTVPKDGSGVQRTWKLRRAQ